ncbi:hypothetical protein D3C73_1075630 [compost metagenome]
MAANLHVFQHDAFEHFVPRVTQNHLEPKPHGKLRTGLGDTGIPRQQQALGRADAYTHPVDFTLDTHTLFTIIEQAARTALQIHFADQPTSAQQRRLQFPQMRLHLAIGIKLLDQHVQHPATGQADA